MSEFPFDRGREEKKLMPLFILDVWMFCGLKAAIAVDVSPWTIRILGEAVN